MWIDLVQELLTFRSLNTFFFFHNIIYQVPDLFLHLFHFVHQVIEFLDIILLLYHLQGASSNLKQLFLKLIERLTY